MSKGLTMVKPESLLLSSSGLELGLLEEAEAGPINGSENTSGEQAGIRLFPDVFLRVRRGWAWPENAPLPLRPSSSLETRMKSSEVTPPVHPGISEEACEVKPEEKDGDSRNDNTGQGPMSAVTMKATWPPHPVLNLERCLLVLLLQGMSKNQGDKI